MDPRNELDDLRQRHARLEQEAEALRRDAAMTARELLRVIELQRDAFDVAAAAAASLATLRASNTGRLLAATERWRLRFRRARMGLRGRVAKRRGRRRTLTVAPEVAQGTLGVNVAGYISAESGLGEATRCSVRGLQLAGVPVALNNVRSLQRTADGTFTAFDDDHPHAFNLVHLNADNMESFARERGRDYFSKRYTIGYWFWELEDFRPDWLPAFEYVDEVWVASEHSRRSIGKDAPVPVVHVPLGLPEPIVGAFGRAHFGVPDRTFVFLYTFDVSSQMERKNPLGAIRAFRLAGLAHDEAILLLKFTNGHSDRSAVRRLAEAASGLNVLMLDGALHRPELNALMQATDCCLSLHRAEGFGMTIAEHMAMGKPAIATAYSGNVDFMTRDVSCLVDAKLVRLTHDYGPYLRGYAWADPDVEQAAGFIRSLVRTPGLARDLGERGRAHVTRMLSPARTATLMRSRLEQIRAGALQVSGRAPALDDQSQTYA